MGTERARKLDVAQARDEAATTGRSSKRRVTPPRYAVGAADDAAEREADVTADVIARRLRAETATLGPAFAPATPSRIRRREVPAEGVIGSAGGPMDDSLADDLDRSRRGGQHLTAPHRGRIEQAMHMDLSAVKIHADPAADQLAHRIQARAFTSGSDVYFASGQYRPGTEHGDHLLAHELAHVAQQSGGRIHRSTVQRRLSINAARLDALRSTSERLKRAFVSDTYSKLHQAVADYPKRTGEIRREALQVRLIMVLCDTYLKKHGGDPAARKRVELVEDLHAEAFRDLGKLRAEARYMRDAYNPTSPTALKSQKQTAHTHTGAKALGKGQTTDQVLGADDESLAAAREYGLTEAEILALRTYTAKDYTYINPATANAPGWLASQNPGADQKNLFEEGSLHAGVMMEGLSKLPVMKGTTYRGARMTPTDYAAKYAVGNSIPFTAFASSATKQDPAQDFADGGGDVAPGPKQTVSVMCIMKTTNARDVRNFSIYGAKEEEWLLLPGAAFKVDRIEDDPIHTKGRPQATAWKIVHMTQTK